MRVLSFAVLVFLLGLKSKAQNIDFVLNKELNILITKKEGKSPYAFEILNESGTKTIKKPSMTIVSQHYKKTLAFAEKAKRDSLKIAKLKEEGKSTFEIAKEINVASVKTRLGIARRSLKNVEKYKTVPSQIIIEKYNELKIRRNIFKPQNVLIGEFKNLGSYHVTKKKGDYNERSLISVADAKKNNVTSDYFLFGDVFKVIQNIETKVIYMVFPDFLEKYPINILASQKKLIKNVNLSKAESLNNIDKKIDSLILDYNKRVVN